MFETCSKHVSNGFKTRLNVFQTKTPKKRFTISPLFIWRVTIILNDTKKVTFTQYNQKAKRSE